MSRGRQKIEVHGLLQQNVLGTFPVIRGFADLRDLAEVSVAIPYDCEVGYAKSRGIPFILTFHEKDPVVGPPWERKDAQGNRVHFDLAAFRYVSYDNPLHLRDQLKTELDALFEEGRST